MSAHLGRVCFYCRTLHGVGQRESVNLAAGLYRVVRLWNHAPDCPQPIALCEPCVREWIRDEKVTGLTVAPVALPATPADVDAALARLAHDTLPVEPKGATLLWRAIERERGYDDPGADGWAA